MCDVDWMRKNHCFMRNFPDREDWELFVIWDKKCLEKVTIGVVGPRDPLLYTQQVVTVAMKTMKLYECTTVSWWARWVDMLTHMLSLEYDLPTVLVLGWWIRRALSSTKKWLINRIVDRWWVVISQFSLDQKPARWTFPQRNKLIAHLSDVVFCPAAWKKSWSMSTIRCMIALQKPVCTVPSPLRQVSTAWTNELLTAWKVIGIDNFQKYFSSLLLRKTPISVLSITEHKIAEAIFMGAHTVDALSQTISEDTLLLDLLSLERKWIICQQYVWYYVVIDWEVVMNIW